MTEQELIAILQVVHEKAAEQIYDRVLRGARSISDVENVLSETTRQERQIIGDYLDQFGSEEVVNRKWNSGKNYIESLQESMERTREDLERTFQESLDELAAEARDIFLSRRAHETDTIFVTEETRILAEMIQNAFPYYRYMTEEDSRVCPYCRPLNGLVFDTIDARVGYNLPPMHPRCRCRIEAMN